MGCAMSDAPDRDSLIGLTITEIRPMPSDPAVRSIRVGRRAAARLRASDIDILGVSVGDEWTTDLAERVAHLQAVERIRRDALKLLSARDRTIADLTNRLARKNHDAGAIRTAITELAEDGWVDDARFARTLAEELVERKHAGAAMIRRTLRQRGVEESLIDSTISGVTDEIDPVEQALDFAEKKFRTMTGVAPMTAARRLAGALARRGYR